MRWQPEGCGSLLYVLYEVLSSTPVAGYASGRRELRLSWRAWLKSYQDPAYPVLATLSDGEETIAAAFKSCWPDAPHQRCQMHFLGNLAEEVLKEDDQLRKNLRERPGWPSWSALKQAGAEDQTPLF